MLCLLFSMLFILPGYSTIRELPNATVKSYPRLLLNRQSVSEIRKEAANYPLMDKSVTQTIQLASMALQHDIRVPVPKDAGGGYTHERHKQNYMDMYHAGIAYQLTGDKKYARFVEKMLLEYAVLYPTLGIHPEKGNQSAGKLFWQGLNETVWLVYTIQAYDCVKEAISKSNQRRIENGVFRPMVHFFTVEDNFSFNRIHNHGTWCVAAVGMTGIVLNEPEWVKMSLWGSDLSGNGGFYKQLDQLFSPDGYYAEGPYYQRYSLLPFVMFAQALDNNYPALEILNYRDGMIAKVVNTALQLTDDYGYFFPYNNSIKAKNFTSGEIVFGLSIAYALSGNTGLLDVAGMQGRVMISAQGLQVARDHAIGKKTAFSRESILLSDGPNGDEGAIAILRNGEPFKGQTLLFKFASQGMGHGHFDRLQYLFYDQGREIMSDYASARFVNVEPKFGGRYLPENNTWAKQTIAHNTVTLNRTSHFNGRLAPAEEHAPSLILYKKDGNNNQMVAAVDSNAYEKAIIRRAMALVNTQRGAVVLDLFDVVAPGENLAEYATYYQGQIIRSTLPYNAFTNSQTTFGENNGYQHLWHTAKSEALKQSDMHQISFLANNSFYTISTLMKAGATLNFVRTGANDPDFNLRSEPGLVISQPFNDRHVFATVVEPHGSYDPVSEMVAGSDSAVMSMEVKAVNEDEFEMKVVVGKEHITWRISFNPAHKNNAEVSFQELK